MLIFRQRRVQTKGSLHGLPDQRMHPHSFTLTASVMLGYGRFVQVNSLIAGARVMHVTDIFDNNGRRASRGAYAKL